MMHPITDRRRFPPEDIKFGAERFAIRAQTAIFDTANPFPPTDEEKLGDPARSTRLPGRRRPVASSFNHRHRGGREPAATGARPPCAFARTASQLTFRYRELIPGCRNLQPRSRVPATRRAGEQCQTR